MKRSRIKAKKTPRKTLRRKLNTLFTQAIIRRDESICQKCGKYVTGQNRHVSHVVPVSYSLRMAYDMVNAKILCFHHHINWFHKNPLDAAEWYKTKFPKRWEYLQTRKLEVLKLGSVKDYELEEWIKEYE